ncbi:hypothetical protein SAMN05192558_10490 [Actinokineospora alba]|uniref:SAF domain-containing protein n=1 Tax=Actinokineospora alba TaxID=504798 RepID=A0A1H0LC46_9PSEU|nr:SAF domain-containing protein [Actinokineospora alba]TDP67272.1 hypothetical protein C8E96_2809 [Actinokineospora alba]SDJ02053.1 hypothetical protein SAMN05421871_109207 [Actinokineospora alba]SDO65767.1 hypothetical protein SAMN05192558_10490 [Actinokineospora alba]
MSTTIPTETDGPVRSVNGSWGTDGRKPASRLRGAARRRSLPHLLLGALLVLACAAAFLLVSLNTGDKRSVLALARPVSVGQVLGVQDLKQVSVSVGPGVSVVDVGQAATVVGKTLSTSLPAGALLTLESVSGAGVPAPGQALAALSLKSGQFPSEISPGVRVSVVFVPGQPGTGLASPPTADEATVWPAVVTSVTSPPNQQITVVSVQVSEAAARQVAAVPAGQLSIVMLAAGGR